MAVADAPWVFSGPVLVVAAHPDDEVLGCGGTIARLTPTVSFVIAILGEGVTSRYPRREEVQPDLIAALQRQSREVGAALGAMEVRMLGLPDNRFDGLGLLNVVKEVERLVEDVTPHTVLTHHPGDLNIDHGITFRAVMTATRPISGSPVREVYAFEVPSSTEWAFQSIAPAFRPNVFVDISRTIDRKIDAMLHYEGESRPFPHPRSAEALRAIARRWGAAVGCSYAEAFELIRAVR